MWIVLKYKQNNFSTLIKEFKDTIGPETLFYVPKIKYRKKTKGKIKEFSKNILENYCICYNSKFNDDKVLALLQYVRGFKYFLKGHKVEQQKIKNFVENYKIHENSEGYLKPSFFTNLVKTEGKFLDGPFANLVFKILEENNNKIKILLGNFKTTIDKRSGYLYSFA